jgi:hypothetical protein
MYQLGNRYIDRSWDMDRDGNWPVNHEGNWSINIYHLLLGDRYGLIDHQLPF